MITGWITAFFPYLKGSQNQTSECAILDSRSKTTGTTGENALSGRQPATG